MGTKSSVNEVESDAIKSFEAYLAMRVCLGLHPWVPNVVKKWLRH